MKIRQFRWEIAAKKETHAAELAPCLWLWELTLRLRGRGNCVPLDEREVCVDALGRREAGRGLSGSEGVLDDQELYTRTAASTAVSLSQACRLKQGGQSGQWALLFPCGCAETEGGRARQLTPAEEKRKASSSVSGPGLPCGRPAMASNCWA